MPLTERMRSWARCMKQNGVILWFACKHPETPLMVKILGIVVVAYALSPIDLIPDFIPVLGYLDDVILLPGLIWLTLKLLPPRVLAECRIQASEWMEREGKPRTRWGIVFVVAVWAFVIWIGGL